MKQHNRRGDARRIKTIGAPVRERATGRRAEVVATYRDHAVRVRWMDTDGEDRIAISALCFDDDALTMRAEALAQRGGIAGLLRRLDGTIGVFDHACEAAQYTDTGDVWDLLNHIREEVRNAVPIALGLHEKQGVAHAARR